MTSTAAIRSFRILGSIALVAALIAASSYFFDRPSAEAAFGDRSTAGWVAAVFSVCGLGMLFLWRWAAVLFAIPFTIVAVSTLIQVPSRFVFPDSIFEVIVAIVFLGPAVLTWRGWPVLRNMVRVEVTRNPPSGGAS